MEETFPQTRLKNNLMMSEHGHYNMLTFVMRALLVYIICYVGLYASKQL